MALFRKRPAAAPTHGVMFDPAGGVPAARAALEAMTRGDWRVIEDEHGPSRDWDTRGAITQVLAELDPFDDWIASAPTSALAYSVRGAQLRRLAWTVRGNGKAATVARDAWGDFFSLLAAAEESLLRATELEPADPYPWSQLIWTGTGLQVETDEKLRRFEAMRQRDPGYLHGWIGIPSAVAKKWGGSHEVMFDIARDGDRTLPPGSLGRVGLLRAHHERWLYLEQWENNSAAATAYYKRPDVGGEIGFAATNSVFSPAHRPSASTRLAQSWFAHALALVGDGNKAERVRAAGLFELLGTQGIPDEPWSQKYGDAAAGRFYVRIRALCCRAAGIPEPPVID